MGENRVKVTMEVTVEVTMEVTMEVMVEVTMEVTVEVTVEVTEVTRLTRGRYPSSDLECLSRQDSEDIAHC